MSKRKKLRGVSPIESAAMPVGTGSPRPSIEACPPKTAFQIKVCLLIGLTLFFILRLFFLPRSVGTWDDVGAIDTIARNPNHISPVVLMRQWSYAPAQFYLTSVLVGFAHDYISLLFWGRLPSLLAWGAGLGLSFWGFRQLLGKAQPALIAGLTVLAALSLRGLFESSQAYNYASGLPCAVFLAWLFASEKGFGWLTESRRMARPVLAGLAAGMTCWFTYQSLFVAMGGFLMVGGVCAWKRNYGAFKGVVTAGLAFTFVFWFVYAYSLKYVQSRGGSWAGGLPGGTVAQQLTFLPGAWFKVIENNVSFLLPPVGSVVVTVILLGLAGAGAVRLAKMKALNPVEGRVLGFLGALVLIWSGAAYAKAFPLSPTRHTYILQFPLLLGLGIALKYLNLPRKFYALATALMVIAFGLAAPGLWRTTRNQFDAAIINRILTENPSSVMLQYPGGSILDMFLLFREHPEWQQRMVDGTWNWPGFMQQLSTAPASVAIYTFGGHAPMQEKDIATAKAAGFKVVTVEEIIAERGGCVEPWRQDVFGGNGFRLYKLERGQ